jgi:uncharacterized membrane protein
MTPTVEADLQVGLHGKGGPRAARVRLASVDIIRGAVMVLMAVDHVRVYAGVPAGGPDPAIFFTRWITHFCAPAFIFLAGASAFLYGRKQTDALRAPEARQADTANRPRGSAGYQGAEPLGRFLITRGAWLILLELTMLRVAWTFNVEFGRYNMAGVIWVIGCCMILLALLVRLPPAAIGGIGVVMIAAHNLLDPLLFSPAVGQGPLAGLWKILYIGFYAGPLAIGGSGPPLLVLYSVVPWIGVMAAGYAFGVVLTLDPERRRRVCLFTGLGALALFLVLRGFNVYGNPQPWSAPAPDAGPEALPALLSFLNTNKYPASLAFLLMTLGPTIALLPLLERSRGALARSLAVFGRVPFFYYVLHIPLIHVMAILVSLARTGSVTPWLFGDHPMAPPPAPEGYMWSLGLLYAVWAIAIVLLYFPCRWFADLKSRRDAWWLQYL